MRSEPQVSTRGVAGDGHHVHACTGALCLDMGDGGPGLADVQPWGNSCDVLLLYRGVHGVTPSNDRLTGQFPDRRRGSVVPGLDLCHTGRVEIVATDVHLVPYPGGRYVAGPAAVRSSRSVSAE
jgi:hypothetical protein